MWSLLLALVMLALLPIGWDGSLTSESWEQTETGYDAGNDARDEPEEQEALAEQRSLSIVRTIVAEPAARLLDRAALPCAAPAPSRLARPYIPHPSRFSERRLI